MTWLFECNGGKWGSFDAAATAKLEAAFAAEAASINLDTPHGTLQVSLETMQQTNAATGRVRKLPGDVRLARMRRNSTPCLHPDNRIWRRIDPPLPVLLPGLPCGPKRLGRRAGLGSKEGRRAPLKPLRPVLPP